MRLVSRQVKRTNGGLRTTPSKSRTTRYKRLAWGMRCRPDKPLGWFFKHLSIHRPMSLAAAMRSAPRAVPETSAELVVELAVLALSVGGGKRISSSRARSQRAHTSCRKTSTSCSKVETEDPLVAGAAELIQDGTNTQASPIASPAWIPTKPSRSAATGRGTPILGLCTDQSEVQGHSCRARSPRIQAKGRLAARGTQGTQMAVEEC